LQDALAKNVVVGVSHFSFYLPLVPLGKLKSPTNFKRHVYRFSCRGGAHPQAVEGD
jgi:hypothetical protein